MRRTVNRLKFALEHFVQRGPWHLLLLAAGLILLVSLIGGLLAWAATDAFGALPEALWWAFLRLSDPGYLGDDQGLALRSISTVLTVLGYVLFLGALVAILTQWLNATFRRLESGLTPIALEDHVVVLGWTSRTAPIVRELMRSEDRVEGFLRWVGAPRLNVAVLAEDAGPARLQLLREHVGPHYDSRRILMRSGSALRMEHLRRVDFQHAAAIVLPASDRTDSAAASQDSRALKALLSIASATRDLPPDELPLVVTEVLDTAKVPLARSTYAGPMEIVATDAFVARVLVQTLRHPGLSAVNDELLSHGEGSEMYVRSAADLVGLTVGEMFPAFPAAIPIGVVRPYGLSFETFLNPLEEVRLGRDDRLVLVARDAEATEPDPTFVARRAPSDVPAGVSCPPQRGARRVLVLGWSHKVPALLAELDGQEDEQVAVDVASRVPVDERARILRRQGVAPCRAQVRHIEADYTAPAELRLLEPDRYDNVVLLASDRLQSAADSDARTILGYLVLRQLVPETAAGPRVVAELMDPANVGLLPGRVELVVSSLIVSHMLTHIALRRELRAVFDELYGPGGADIAFRPAAHYGLAGREVGFMEVQTAVAARGEVALGVRLGDGVELDRRLHLNPDRAQRYSLCVTDEVVVLTAG